MLPEHLGKVLLTGESVGAASSRQRRVRTAVHILLMARLAKSALHWLGVFSTCVALVGMTVGVVRGGISNAFARVTNYGWCAMGLSMCAAMVYGVLYTGKGFKPRYSRYVARQARGSIDKAAHAGVVLIEARVVSMASKELPPLLRQAEEGLHRSGNEDAPLVRPPLILEDDSGLRLYLPVTGQVIEGRSGDPLLGDQTNGILYRVGEPVIFVGTVSPWQSSPGYRDSGDMCADVRVADVDWLALRGATREEVVKGLQQGEMSRAPVIGMVLLIIASLTLSVLACFGH